MGPTAGLPASYRLARNLPFAMDSRVADVGVARVRPEAEACEGPLPSSGSSGLVGAPWLRSSERRFQHSRVVPERYVLDRVRR